MSLPSIAGLYILAESLDQNGYSEWYSGVCAWTNVPDKALRFTNLGHAQSVCSTLTVRPDESLKPPRVIKIELVPTIVEGMT